MFNVIVLLSYKNGERFAIPRTIVFTEFELLKFSRINNVVFFWSNFRE